MASIRLSSSLDPRELGSKDQFSSSCSVRKRRLSCHDSGQIPSHVSLGGLPEGALYPDGKHQFMGNSALQKHLAWDEELVQIEVVLRTLWFYISK